MSWYRPDAGWPFSGEVGARERAGPGLVGRDQPESGCPRAALAGGWRTRVQRSRSRAPPRRIRRKAQPDTEGIGTVVTRLRGAVAEPRHVQVDSGPAARRLGSGQERSRRFGIGMGGRIRSLDKPLRRRVLAEIDALAGNPRPTGYKKLAGGGGWRTRVGDYWVVCEIHDQVLLVIAVDIGNHGEIFR